jgi:hypothetical protein
VNQAEVEAYNRKEIREVIRAFKAMDEKAVEEAKKVSNSLSEYLKDKIVLAADRTRNKIDDRVAAGSRIRKTSKIGEISFGFASQRLRGGGTTQQLWGGAEFGSSKYKQFPSWSGRQGRGSRGWFIYPTLRKEQPYIINEWQQSFSKIIKEF